MQLTIVNPGRPLWPVLADKVTSGGRWCPPITFASRHLSETKRDSKIKWPQVELLAVETLSFYG